MRCFDRFWARSPHKLNRCTYNEALIAGENCADANFAFLSLCYRSRLMIVMYITFWFRHRSI
ncbi:MAG: hypothetical protein F6K28_41965 [Microcoleus sp. SIO2G3]|nr:hypothetical protein [Microcoleus sp. SIO2G3]